MSDKGDMRRQVKARLAAVTKEERAAWSQALTERVLALDQVRRAQRVMLFWGMDFEPDTRPLMAALQGQEKALYLPRVLGAGRMEMAPYRLGDPVLAGPYGIWEPVSQAATCVPDLVLAPGVAFDRQGGRLGHGAGYYDRFLRDTGASALGLCFACQIVDRVPMDQQDIPMARVVTPCAIYPEGEGLTNC